MEKFYAGIARTDITPKPDVRLGGYGVKERPAENVNDPLHSTAMFFRQGDIQTALIALDWLGISEQDVAVIRRMVEAETGIAPENVIVTTSHTHTAPCTIHIPGWGELEKKYIDEVTPLILESVVNASRNMKPVKVGIRTIPSKTGVNRRAVGRDGKIGFGADPDGIYDPAMTVVKFESGEGPLAVIVHYGAHGTAFGNVRVVSRDWPGVMADRVESLTGAPVLFLNGPVGDVGPRMSVVKNGAFTAGVGDGLDSVREVGYRAAADAMEAYAGIKSLSDDFSLDIAHGKVFFKYAGLPSVEEAEKKLKEFEPRKDESGAGGFEYVRWKKIVDACHSGNVSAGKEYNQSILRIGPLAVVPFPGELFSGISLRLRKWSPFEHTLCTSVSNGYYTYIPTQEALQRGGYEVWMAKAYNGYGFADDIDDLLIEQNLDLLEKLFS